ncbi:L-lactate MFS transporter [Candidatus Cetobacterium colombiensis]|uniref:OFA family MFS transporter n=1 Tax=Candidatus Cetobacterium colombiensis TaxID=3073100 RepID=A0ABU4WE51_9FUSO|nr:OFA family MFS transporter [Candidatus Cetobacterium colombiensis]MDX8336846.1 OFA family MFS transporter [Candidatus Cetobacterium colombiensis]
MKRRESYIIIGLIMFLCMGTIYSWGVFQRPLVKILEQAGGKHISSTMAGMPYTVFLFFYAFSMPVAGLFIKKVNPKGLSILGSFLIALAWILAGFAESIEFIIATYGILGGIGVGIVYGIPMAIVAEWFPDKKGFAVGLTLLGFGLSPFLTAPLAGELIAVFGVFSTFKILGILFFIVLTLLSLFLKFPNGNEKQNDKKNVETLKELKPKEMLKTSKFYALWICYTIGAFCGLMIIGISSSYAQEVIKITPLKAAFFTSFFAVFNGIGRPLFGIITDKLGSKNAITVSYLSIIFAGVISILFKSNIVAFTLAFSIMWLNLGGWLAIAPASTINIFGKLNYSSNYGILFTAYGIGAISQGFIGGYFRETFGSYIYIFYPIVIACIIGLIIARIFIKDN